MFRCLRASTFLFASLPAFAALADKPDAEWSRFRGPNGTGVASADIPASWTEKDFAWKIPLPGKGHSSPVVRGDKVFVTAGEGGRRVVLCVNAADGRTLWKHETAAASYKMHKFNSVATGTPAADDKHVYTAFATPQQITVEALDHSGKPAWKAEQGAYAGNHGFGCSPVVYQDMVVIAIDQDGGGFLIALDAANGKERWRVPRKSKNATYSTPCVFAPAGAAPVLIFTNWQHGITAVDPKTGKVAWETSVFDVEKQERAIASPVIAGDLVLGTCGFVTAQKHLVAVRPGDPAKGEKPREVWRIERAVSYLPTPLVKGDRVFLCSEQGIATWLEAATGKIIWQERVGGSFYSSPVCAGDRIFCISTTGELTTLAASDKFEVLGKGSLGEPTQSTPAISGGRMFVRTDRHLFAIGSGKQPPRPTAP